MTAGEAGLEEASAEVFDATLLAVCTSAAPPEDSCTDEGRAACTDALGRVAQRLHIESGVLFNFVRKGMLTEEQLDGMLDSVRALTEGPTFRHFGGRSIWDFKLFGERSFVLPVPFEFLNPLMQVMLVLADLTMQPGEELALIQVLVNYLGGYVRFVNPHRHRCRQLCASLGEACTVEVEGRPLVMHHGDCLPLGGEVHGVPVDIARRSPRVSVCLFYSSKEEFRKGTVGLSGDPGGGLHFVHPDDLPPHPSMVQEAQLGEHTGTVKYMSDIYDYGIILCAALKELGYEDVFVKKKKLVRMGLEVGSQVHFSAYLNKKGAPQVKDLLR